MATKILDDRALMELPQRTRANFINSLSGFKSANLVGTKNIDGVDNLSIVSSVFHVGAHPPLLGMLMRPHTVKRDTLQNIKDTGVYTINHVHKSFADKAHQCSANYPSDESEFEALGLTPKISSLVNAPFVAESKIRIALKVEQITLIELNQTELVIGRVVEVELDDDILCKDGYVDIEKAQSVAVSCLDSYHSTVRIDRYGYAKPNQALTSIWQDTDVLKS
ncbi:MAG: flavin reductase (DIM6/NTAB) family NADH-FMN oxidoreductase RutF [Alphaproteobacteria bacterium]|jgi:flavin reductase (DIM6/NTAB) family NADH-FMN oxidoreductase RutF